jgi:large subunit ribosomal protein L27
VMLGKDHTVFAVVDGVVKFTKGANDRRFVHVLPVAAEA